MKVALRLIELNDVVAISHHLLVRHGFKRGLLFRLRQFVGTERVRNREDSLIVSPVALMRHDGRSLRDECS